MAINMNATNSSSLGKCGPGEYNQLVINEQPKSSAQLWLDMKRGDKKDHQRNIQQLRTASLKQRKILLNNRIIGTHAGTATSSLNF